MSKCFSTRIKLRFFQKSVLGLNSKIFKSILKLFQNNLLKLKKTNANWTKRKNKLKQNSPKD